MSEGRKNDFVKQRLLKEGMVSGTQLFKIGLADKLAFESPTREGQL
jgi:hypothetical protein